jgi:secondary thiamine-phosphate synthase enzyme
MSQDEGMDKSSTVTRRDTPLAEVANASAGVARIHSQTLSCQTAARMELVDLTTRVVEVVHASGVHEGTVNVWSLHTTCALMVNEFQKALLADITRVLEELVVRDGAWKHNDPAHSDCNRSNADSHLRAMLLGHSLTLQVSGGELVLGQWQRILLAEFDGPRTRSLRVQVAGMTEN